MYALSSQAMHISSQLYVAYVQVRALILENTFLSLPRLIPSAMPWLSPVSFLCHQKWDSASKIPLIPIQTPILMLSGERDEVVPSEHMEELERLMRNVPGRGRRPGKLIEFKNGQHSTWEFYLWLIRIAQIASDDTCVQPGYWNAVADFIASLT